MRQLTPLQQLQATADIVAFRHSLALLGQFGQIARAEARVQLAVEQEQALFEASPGSGMIRISLAAYAAAADWV